MAPAETALAMVAALASSPASAAPLPPDRPAAIGIGRTPAAPPHPPTTPPSPAGPATPPSGDAGCLDSLRQLGATAEAVAAPAVGDPACAIESPVQLAAVASPFEPGRTIAFPDAPVLACRQAVALTPWIGRIAAPILKAAHGAALKAVRTGPGFACRGRNRQPDAKLSAHALGLALDIAAFELADGRLVSVKLEGARETPDPAFEAIRQAGCGWFTTVLGPGSDAFHADHLHVDIQRHGTSDRYRICQ